MSTPLRTICLAGPTGIGKTAAALALAQACDGEIINADSRQVYADFPIITAQPSEDEIRDCPHHLYGFLKTEEKLSAGRWAAMAADKAREVIERGNTPILVGGTGLYFKALLEGIADIPLVEESVSVRLAARCAAEGVESLHAELTKIDPAYASRIHNRDHQRVLRSLEVYESTGKPFSWWHSNAATSPLCEGLFLGLDMKLEELEPRLGVRIDAMLEAGALQEARKALTRCNDSTAPGWSGIGCRELYRHLQGEWSLAEARDAWVRNTRAYAKRQMTWFRAQKNLRTFPPGDMKSLCLPVQLFLL